jgi:hypothetical protein
MIKRYFSLALALLAVLPSPGQDRLDPEFVEEYLLPTRIIKVSGVVSQPENLLNPYPGQVSIFEPQVTIFGSGGSVLLDFGKEIQGGIEIVRAISSGDQSVSRFRVCLGESVSEALSSVSEEGTSATNDHSARDVEVSVPWLGTARIGDSGFRFARLDFLNQDAMTPIVAVRAVSRYRGIPWQGSFRCSDERLEKIWQTGAYTVLLNMQEYLWDGIKRDRLVWMGDMHPEVMAVGTVFGNHQVVRKSLDFVRDETPPETWMNGMCSYSLWWIVIQHHLYQWYGDLPYLEEQHDYLAKLLRTVISQMDGTKEAYASGRFLDWPSNSMPEIIHAGLQALSVRALEAGADMAKWLGDNDLQNECATVAARLKTHVPENFGNSQAAALLSLSGMMDPSSAADIIIANGPEKFTSFMGYYFLEALAKAGRYNEAMDLISKYWGRMLELGATTFWEDFNYNDGKNAARIDEIVPEGKFDIHADGGAWCYVGLRHSFCHGWASGPTTWLSRHVLGVEPVGEGFRKVRIEPHLGDLEWAEVSFPTPYGVIEVSCRKKPDGTLSTKVRLPKGVRRVK